MGRPRPPDAFEQEVLDVVLRYFRLAVRRKTQLAVLLDPWTLGDGTYISADLMQGGHTYTIARKGRRGR